MLNLSICPLSVAILSGSIFHERIDFSYQMSCRRIIINLLPFCKLLLFFIYPNVRRSNNFCFTYTNSNIPPTFVKLEKRNLGVIFSCRLLQYWML